MEFFILGGFQLQEGRRKALLVVAGAANMQLGQQYSAVISGCYDEDEAKPLLVSLTGGGDCADDSSDGVF
jgi:hypothetical protein